MQESVAQRNGLRTGPGEARADCEWSKGDRPGTVRNEPMGLEYVVDCGWLSRLSVLLLFAPKSLQTLERDCQAQVNYTRLPLKKARAQRRQINNNSRSPQRRAGEPNTGSACAF